MQLLLVIINQKKRSTASVPELGEPVVLLWMIVVIKLKQIGRWRKLSLVQPVPGRRSGLTRTAGFLSMKGQSIP